MELAKAIERRKARTQAVNQVVALIKAESDPEIFLADVIAALDESPAPKKRGRPAGTKVAKKSKPKTSGPPMIERVGRAGKKLGSGGLAEVAAEVSRDGHGTVENAHIASTLSRMLKRGMAKRRKPKDGGPFVYTFPKK